jgi:hypothetical protein
MNGAYFLGIMTLVLAVDMLIALRFLRVADRAESEVGAPRKAGGIDPVASRRFARIMLFSTPVIWLFCVAFSFGLFGSTGNIIPIKF